MEPVIPEEIVRAAMAEPGLRGRVFLCSTRRKPLLVDGEVVGFVTPHETKSGWRAGPIFVMPAFRGRGLVEAFYAANRDRTWVAFVADQNASSLAMHQRAGFRDWKKARGGRWMRLEHT